MAEFPCLNATLAAYLGGTSDGQPTPTWTIYGFVVPDAVLTERGTGPANDFYLSMFDTVGLLADANKARALKRAAQCRAGWQTLNHLRQMVATGDRSTNVGIGKLSVTKPAPDLVLSEASVTMQREELTFLSMLQGGGSVNQQNDLVISNPIYDPNLGQSLIGLDSPAPYTSNGPGSRPPW